MGSMLSAFNSVCPKFVLTEAICLSDKGLSYRDLLRF